MKIPNVRGGVLTLTANIVAIPRDASLYDLDQKCADVLAWIGRLDSMADPQVLKRSQI